MELTYSTVVQPPFLKRKFFGASQGLKFCENHVDLFEIIRWIWESKCRKNYRDNTAFLGEMDADNSGNLDSSDHQNSSREGEFVDFAVCLTGVN